MSLISNLYIQDDRCLIIWMNKSNMVRKAYAYPVTAVLFSSAEKILIIEPDNSNKEHSNAVIYNNDGSEFLRLKKPIQSSEFICFSDAYYVKDKLNVFFMTKHAYYRSVLNESGELSEVGETR